MNRERLTILRDHLASLPDEQFGMETWGHSAPCGTVACIGGWAAALFGKSMQVSLPENDPGQLLGLTSKQEMGLFIMTSSQMDLSEATRADAIAAIQSMLDSPDDEALPVWPERA